ncbi:hypothetical protein FACS189490_05700 [Clostridia bacterium]|nr:hypothetical protein FACS189490_05700 [Clostridia bacterium]
MSNLSSKRLVILVFSVIAALTVVAIAIIVIVNANNRLHGSYKYHSYEHEITYTFYNENKVQKKDYKRVGLEYTRTGNIEGTYVLNGDTIVFTWDAGAIGVNASTQTFNFLRERFSGTIIIDGIAYQKQ